MQLHLQGKTKQDRICKPTKCIVYPYNQICTFLKRGWEISRLKCDLRENIKPEGFS